MKKQEEIKSLLEDFLEVNLQEDEEQRLKAHFAQKGKSDDPFFEEYFDYLRHYEEQKEKPLRVDSHSIQRFLKISTFAWYRSAAALLLIIIGFAAGWYFSTGTSKTSNTEIELLSDDLDDLRKELVMMRIDMPMASDRIQAVQYAESLASEDDQMINVLGEVLISDDDINVRLAAAYALFGFADNSVARQKLILAIDHKSQEALVQLSLINMMLSLREKSAISNIRRALLNEAIPEEEQVKIETKLTEWL